jgi:hypothetical protein
MHWCSDTTDLVKETLEQQFLLVRNRTSNNGERSLCNISCVVSNNGDLTAATGSESFARLTYLLNS